jgi:RNA polymerase sigma-70 factor, ECF subfamily
MTEHTMSLQTELDPAVIRSKSSDPAVVDALVQQYYPHVLRFAHSILDNHDEAEDAAQEALIAAVSSLAKFRGESSFKTWLYGITLNVCRGHMRKRKMRQSVVQALQMVQMVAGNQPTPEDSTQRLETDSELWRAVEGLDEAHRTVVILRYVHELPVKDISRIMKINEGTVHSRLHYARKTLQYRLTSAGSVERIEREAR